MMKLTQIIVAVSTALAMGMITGAQASTVPSMANTGTIDTADWLQIAKGGKDSARDKAERLQEVAKGGKDSARDKTERLQEVAKGGKDSARDKAERLDSEVLAKGSQGHPKARDKDERIQDKKMVKGGTNSTRDMTERNA